jgi:hypothetical protein
MDSKKHFPEPESERIIMGHLTTRPEDLKIGGDETATA